MNTNLVVKQFNEVFKQVKLSANLDTVRCILVNDSKVEYTREEFSSRYLFVGYKGEDIALSAWSYNQSAGNSINFPDLNVEEKRKLLWQLHTQQNKYFKTRKQKFVGRDNEELNELGITREISNSYLKLLYFQGNEIIYLSNHDRETANLFQRFLTYIRQ